MSMPLQSTQLITATLRNALTNSLLAWYTVTRRDLPWRLHRDPYTIWVSEVMLQQTQVKTMTAYFLRWMERFPTIDHLARAGISEVLKLWEGLGYYSRARNLHRAARQVSEVWKGRVPDDWESLRALPGIGDYIAAAVLSIAFEQPYAVVDGNVKRVLARLWCLDTPVNQSGGHRVYQAIARQLLSSRSPGDHNQAMMELGALVCTPARPACHRCPLAGHCCAYGRGAVEHYPIKIPKAAVPVYHFAASVLLKNQRMLLVQRPENGLLGGLWEFPNGPVPPDGDPAADLAAHINAQVNLDAEVGRQVALVRHTYSHFKLHLAVHVCRWRAGRVRLNGPVAFQWVRWNELERFALHRAVQKALPAVGRLLAD
jgi:A/G-specific adenine glycosylase